MSPERGRILVGTCSWADHTNFYPDGLPDREKIRHYAQHFPVVEIDSTFYHMPSERNMRLWAERTPEGFVFDVKAFRQMTWHDREHRPDEESFQLFSSALEPMRQAGKLRAVLLQLPPWVKASPRNHEYLAWAQEQLPEDLVAVEFRHRSWLSDEEIERTLEVVRQLGLIYVGVDEPQLGSGSVPPVVRVTNPELAIVRFHGRNYETWYKRGISAADRFAYLYSEEELARWKPRIEEIASQAREVHALMNNCFEDYAVRNARDLGRMLGELPPDGETAEQGRLL